MPCEIVMFSVWTRKDGVKLFPTTEKAVKHRDAALRGTPDLLEDHVSKIGKHPIKIEDAVREVKKDA